VFIISVEAIKPKAASLLRGDLRCLTEVQLRRHYTGRQSLVRLNLCCYATWSADVNNTCTINQRGNRPRRGAEPEAEH
jgi:hypothetical protein